MTAEKELKEYELKQAEALRPALVVKIADCRHWANKYPWDAEMAHDLEVAEHELAVLDHKIQTLKEELSRM